jgi:hypothetical protein
MTGPFSASVGIAVALVAAISLGGCKPSGEYDKTPELIHTPPLRALNAKQLRALSMECEKYLPGRMARGPYDAAYCEAAMAAWSDSPIQMIQIPQAPSGAR